MADINNELCITVEMKNSYGNTLYYPVCNKASSFASLTGTKTLTADMLKTISSLGYVVKATVEINNQTKAFNINFL
tara:strand:- start:75 stop:302 length:228 start_codon:yes stop_codon:yes gene_type:complete